MQITDKFEIVSVVEITPDAHNARKHSDEQIKELRHSLREFGFVNPLLIDKEKKVIAGHGRLLAAIAEGMTAVPCVYVEHLTEAQRRVCQTGKPPLRLLMKPFANTQERFKLRQRGIFKVEA